MHHLAEDIESRMPRFLAQLQKANRNARLLRLARAVHASGPEAVIYYIGSVDPTGKAGKYVAWIIDMVLSGQIILPEDAERVTYLLKIFDVAKRSRTFQHDKNIFNYKNFSEFAKLVESLGGGEDKAKETQNLSLRKWKAWIERQGYNKFYGDNVFTLLEFKLTGKKEKVIATSHSRGYSTDYLPVWAANTVAITTARPDISPAEIDTGALAISRLVTGTAYCVQNPLTAESYLERGPLYALFREGSLYALSTSQWTEFRDTNDVSLAIPSPALAYFLSKVIFDRREDIDKWGVQVIQRLIKRGMDNYADSLPAKPKAIMLRAIQDLEE